MLKMTLFVPYIFLEAILYNYFKFIVRTDNREWMLKKIYLLVAKLLYNYECQSVCPYVCQCDFLGAI